MTAFMRPHRRDFASTGDGVAHGEHAALLGVPRLLMQALALPFDTLRSLYARGVQVGFIERSLLKNAEFERALCVLERLALGPVARRV